MERKPLPEEIIKVLDIKKGMKILDFGCANGKYSLPVARVVGLEGKIYALDKEKSALDKLESEINRRELKNIELIHGDGKFKLPKASVDIVLLLDVLHLIDFKDELLKQFFDVLKPEGILSIFPHIHFSSDELIRAVTETNYFVLKDRYEGIGIYNFQKNVGCG